MNELLQQGREELYAHAPYALEEKLVGAVIAGDLELANAVLNQIDKSSKKARLAEDELRSVKNSVICTVTLMTRASIKAGVEPNEAFVLSDRLIWEIEAINDTGKVLLKERDVVSSFLMLIRDKSLATYTAPVGRAVYYIESRIDKKLSLSEIAEYARVNQHYLCDIFKKQTGHSVVDYIHRRKAQESLRYLKNRAYKLTDIAIVFDFSSHSHYSAVFKKVFGITPSQMRKTL